MLAFVKLRTDSGEFRRVLKQPRCHSIPPCLPGIERGLAEQPQHAGVLGHPEGQEELLKLPVITAVTVY